MSDKKVISSSVKAVIWNHDGCCLLLKRSADSNHNACKWELPGGKVDPGESTTDALLREVEEETALTISLNCSNGVSQVELTGSRRRFYIYKAYLVRGNVRLSSEHSDYTWADMNKLYEMDIVRKFLPVIEALSDKYAA